MFTHMRLEDRVALKFPIVRAADPAGPALHR